MLLRQFQPIKWKILLAHPTTVLAEKIVWISSFPVKVDSALKSLDKMERESRTLEKRNYREMISDGG